MNHLFLAQGDPFGKIKPPVAGMAADAVDASGKLTGILPFMNSLLRLIFIGAGIFAFVNILWAGVMFINAGSDPEAVSKAWAKIYMSVIGLVVIATSFLFAALIGMLMFGDPGALLNPSLGPRP